MIQSLEKTSVRFISLTAVFFGVLSNPTAFARGLFVIRLQPGESYFVSTALTTTRYLCTSRTGRIPEPVEPDFPGRAEGEDISVPASEGGIQTDSTVLLPTGSQISLLLPSGEDIRIECDRDQGGDFPG
jgi:hypothetical protein